MACRWQKANSISAAEQIRFRISTTIRFAVDDDVTWVRGKHQLALGGEWVQNELNIGNAYESNGIFTFNGQYSGSGPNGGSVIGDQSLDFLQGTMSAFQQSKQQQNALRGPIPSLYAQDTYHATRRLTLVAGLAGTQFHARRLFQPRQHPQYGGLFVQTVSTVYPNTPAALVRGDKGVPGAGLRNRHRKFLQRWVLLDPSGDGKTVVRVGAQLAYDDQILHRSEDPAEPAICHRRQQLAELLHRGRSISALPGPWFHHDQSISAADVPTPAQAQFFPQSQYIVMPQQFHAAYTIQWTLSARASDLAMVGKQRNPRHSGIRLGTIPWANY